MEEMSQGSAKIAAASSDVNAAASESARLAADGTETVRGIFHQLQQIQASVEDADSRVHTLYEGSQEVDEIVEVIKGIADQTSLLALNAAIEASKAGEAGRGFTVVSSEVKKLSEQAMAMTEQIAGIVTKMKHNAADTLKSVSVVKGNMKEGMELMVSADRSLEALLSSARQTAAQIEDISATTQQMSAGSEQIAASMLTITGISKDFAEKTREVSDQTKRQLSHMEDISRASTILSQSSLELEEIMNQLKLAAHK